MKPLRARLRDVAIRTRVSQIVVEKDYALSYLLAGIAAKSELSETLIFKGGTALKKLYFGEYRFSEDLDFSAVGAPREQALEEAIRKAVHAATQMLSAHGLFQIETDRYTERAPHPGGQEAFIARVKFPWYPSPLCRIKIEITHDEPVLLEAERRALITVWSVVALRPEKKGKLKACRIGRLVRYRGADIIQWLEGCKS